MAELSKSNAELQDARKSGDTASQAKSVFLANMSHETRTPLNAVIGFTELMLDTDLSDDQREYLEMVGSSGESLLTVINDILDFSNIEAGKLALEFIALSARDVAADVISSFGVHRLGFGSRASALRRDSPAWRRFFDLSADSSWRN